MNNTENRLKRERKTIQVMVRMYCRSVHSKQKELCPECEELLYYAYEKIDRCLFGTEKPACSECWVHCYAHEKREKIRTIMRYAGPRMMYKHPYLGIMHFVDKYRYEAVKKKK
jgi:predicted amidophosphoribosyltransferase